MRERVIELFYKHIDSDVREELMDTVFQVTGHKPDLVDEITEEIAKEVIYHEIKIHAEEGLEIQGADTRPMLNFLNGGKYE